MPLSIKWDNSPARSNQPAIGGLLTNWKTYMTVLAALSYIGSCWWKGTNVDPNVLIALGFTSVAALRSALKTSVAQIVNASQQGLAAKPAMVDLPIVEK